MKAASNDFAVDPCSAARRGSMIKAARALLTAVTKLLSVADMADIYRLVASLKLVCFSFLDREQIKYDLSLEDAERSSLLAPIKQSLFLMFISSFCTVQMTAHSIILG